MQTEIRVFPRKTEYTPTDELAFVGLPPSVLPTKKAYVSVSITLTWDRNIGRELAREWSRHYDDVRLGGPAFNSYAGPFIPGRFIKEQYFFSSRGCIRKCPWCYIWRWEGAIRELQPSHPQSYCIEDCNIFACSPNHIEHVFSGIIESAKACNTVPQMSAFDARLFTEHHLRLCEDAGLRHVTFACDFPGAERHLKHIYPLLKHKPKEWRECCVLLGYHGGLESGLEQIQKVIDSGFLPAVMLYQDDSDSFWHYSDEWLNVQSKYPRHPNDSVTRQEPDGSIIMLTPLTH
jgi:hypothetical protein